MRSPLPEELLATSFSAALSLPLLNSGTAVAFPAAMGRVSEEGPRPPRPPLRLSSSRLCAALSFSFSRCLYFCILTRFGIAPRDPQGTSEFRSSLCVCVCVCVRLTFYINFCLLSSGNRVGEPESQAAVLGSPVP